MPDKIGDMSIQETVLKIKGAGDLSRVILECALLAVLLIIGFVLWLFYRHTKTIPVVTTPVVSAEPLKLEIKPHHPSASHHVGDCDNQSLGTSPYQGEDSEHKTLAQVSVFCYSFFL